MLQLGKAVTQEEDEESSPGRGIGSQEPAEVLGTATVPIVMSSTSRPKLHNCHIYVADLGWSHAGALVAVSNFMISYESG